MKSLVICLALANVLFLLWTRGIAQSDGDAPPAAGPPPATLRLASEARGSPARGSPPGGATVPGVPAAESAAAAPTAAAPAVAAATSGDPPAGNDAAGGLLGNVQRCISIGPFRDVAEAARSASLLRSGHYDPRQRVVDGEVWAGVWVYLPAAGSAAANEQILAKLKSAGIDDALEMPGPAEGPVISLGLFSEQRRAQARVAQLQGLGFNPALADRKRTGNVYWIDIDLKPTDSVALPADLQTDANRITRLEVKACPTATAQP